MNVPMEFLLMAGILSLYLQDSMLLLHYDEIVMFRAGHRWRATIGSAIDFRGRRLCLLHPLRPTDPVFRLSWLRAGSACVGSAPHTLEPFVGALVRLRHACLLLYGLLFLVLPALLYLHVHPLALLAAASAIYAASLWLALSVWRHRVAYGLTRREALSIGFELLCCPPHAINTIRRLSLRHPLGEDALAAAARHLGTEATAELRTGIGTRLAYVMDFRGDDARLLDAKARLELLR